MKIAIGSDHAGFALKEELKTHLREKGIEVSDHGTTSLDSVDYPDFAYVVAKDVAGQRSDFGILVCGSGIGMAITANKVPGIRAANVTSETEAQLSREHNDLNVLTLGARLLDPAKAKSIVDTWLRSVFAYGRHENRVKKIAEIERNHVGIPADPEPEFDID